MQDSVGMIGKSAKGNGTKRQEPSPKAQTKVRDQRFKQALREDPARKFQRRQGKEKRKRRASQNHKSTEMKKAKWRQNGTELQSPGQLIEPKAKKQKQGQFARIATAAARASNPTDDSGIARHTAATSSGGN